MTDILLGGILFVLILILAQGSPLPRRVIRLPRKWYKLWRRRRATGRPNDG